ncbi:MAG: cation-transporting P-type ATPase [Candidatus ainarchaeum sp.]|nr:cation-transporting P-type ATPase [Candidatus ainarchaeum sp.]
MSENWHSEDLEEIMDKLGSTRKGLSEGEISEKTKIFGLNELVEKKQVSVIEIFLHQFKSIVVLALIIAAVLSLIMEEYLDVAVIVLVLMVNAIIGTFQEYRAEKALLALKKMAASNATVVRSGKIRKIPSRELVPGDIVLLEEGDKVPADVRLIECINLEINESRLT